MSPWRRPRIGPGEIIILMAIGILALIVVTDNHRRILSALSSPTAGFILVIMLIEYVLLKGSDRTDIYRRELEAARQKRRDDLLALRDMETQLLELRARLAAVLEHAEEPQALREITETARQVSDDLLLRLRERI